MFKSNQDIINYLNKNYKEKTSHYLSWLQWEEYKESYKEEIRLFTEVNLLEIIVSKDDHHSMQSVPMIEIIKCKGNLISEVLRIVRKRLDNYIQNLREDI